MTRRARSAQVLLTAGLLLAVAAPSPGAGAGAPAPQSVEGAFDAPAPADTAGSGALAGGAAAASALPEVEIQETAAQIGTRLRCPLCRNQSVTESPSRIARGMQAEIRQLLREGMTPDEVEAYFVDAYGPWILLNPPADGMGLVVYVVPPLIFLGGGLFLLLRLRAARSAA